MDNTDVVVNPTATGNPSSSTGGEVSANGVKTPEELEWEKLTGNSQNRFKEVLSERNQYKDATQKLYQELEGLRSQVQTLQSVPPPPPPDTGKTLSVEEKAAVEVLRNYGLLTVDDAEAILANQSLTEEKLKEAVQTVKDEMLVDTAHSRLEDKYSGKDGLPKYDREIIEDHMRRHAIWDPEKAYNDLYQDELFEHRFKTEKSNRTIGYMTEKPIGSTGTHTEPLTIENVRARLQQPDHKEWWDRNRDRILPALGSLLGQ